MKRLLQLYVDENLPDEMSFGSVREKAFEILPKDEIIKVSNADNKPVPDLDFYWQAVDTSKRRVTLNLRQLVAALNFSSTTPENQWIAALNLIKTEHSHQQRLAPLLNDCPDKTIPTRLLPYLTTKTDNHPDIRVNQSRYEFWVYRQLNNNLKNGSIFLEDSLQHRSLNQELVPVEEVGGLIQQLELPSLTQPIAKQLDDLFTELDQLWPKFNKELKKGKLKHLRYDEKSKTLHWQKNKTKKDEQAQNQFYKQMPLCDITDVMRYVHKNCNYLSALTHIGVPLDML